MAGWLRRDPVTSHNQDHRRASRSSRFRAAASPGRPRPRASWDGPRRGPSQGRRRPRASWGSRRQVEASPRRPRRPASRAARHPGTASRAARHPGRASRSRLCRPPVGHQGRAGTLVPWRGPPHAGADRSFAPPLMRPGPNWLRSAVPRRLPAAAQAQTSGATSAGCSSGPRGLQQRKERTRVRGLTPGRRESAGQILTRRQTRPPRQPRTETNTPRGTGNPQGAQFPPPWPGRLALNPVPAASVLPVTEPAGDSDW
jgi:hypothetical protein